MYTSTTPSHRFWGRSDFLLKVGAPSRDEYNNRTWLADKIYQALEKVEKWAGLEWKAANLDGIKDDEIATASKTALGSPDWASSDDAKKIWTALKVHELIGYERNTKKHSIEKLNTIELAIMNATIEAINVNDSAIELLLNKDITQLEFEHIGQQPRKSDWINSYICDTGVTVATCLTAAQ